MFFLVWFYLLVIQMSSATDTKILHFITHIALPIGLNTKQPKKRFASMQYTKMWFISRKYLIKKNKLKKEKNLIKHSVLPFDAWQVILPQTHSHKRKDARIAMYVQCHSSSHATDWIIECEQTWLKTEIQVQIKNICCFNVTRKMSRLISK